MSMETPRTDTDTLWQAVGEVNDPEFPMSLLDMGLVYGITRDGERVHVQVTFIRSAVK